MTLGVGHSSTASFFSPLGKLADRAIYFTCCNLFFFLTWAKLSQDLLDQFSRSFHQIKLIGVSFLDPDLFYCFRDVAMATDFG